MHQGNPDPKPRKIMPDVNGSCLTTRLKDGPERWDGDRHFDLGFMTPPLARFVPSQ